MALRWSARIETMEPGPLPGQKHRASLLTAMIAAALLSGACRVGPPYQRPAAAAPPAYKEAQPDNPQAAGVWRPAQPNDAALRGKWWTLYNDPELSGLEQQVAISNQNVLSAEAQFREAADAVRIARSSLFPTVSTAPSVQVSRSPAGISIQSSGTSGVHTEYSLPVDVSYEADIWGSIRNSVRAGAATAQASFAQLENARLSYEALLAQDYFQLRGNDAQQTLLQTTVKSYEDYLELTQERLNAGVASGADVAQAQTQLDNARTQLIELGSERAQFEHAIAVLTGKPPEELSLAASQNTLQPPIIPVGLPSDLLERRPDIAEAERLVAAANAQIGVQAAAYFPSLTISGSLGLAGSTLRDLLSWPGRVWSVGPQLAETLFDAGRRHAQVAQARDNYDAQAADYRQTVLTALQQVDDDLAELRVLSAAAASEQDAVTAAQQALDISGYQYRAGTVSYLQVISAQTTALQSQMAAVSILTNRMVTSVLLVEALGGGWNPLALPSMTDLVAK